MPNEALFPFILLTLPLDEFGVSFPPESTFIRMNKLVPFFQAAQFLFGITQHLLEGVVRENRTAKNIEEADPDLGILEN